MERINTPKAAKSLGGDKKKKLILLKDPNFSRIFSVLESRYREFSQNTAGSDAFPGTEEEGRKLTQALEEMKAEKQISIETVREIKGIFVRLRWEFPAFEKGSDESKVYGKNHLWHRNNVKRMDALLKYAFNTQVQIDARDEAEVAAIAKSLKNGTITDEQIQILGRIYKKYIKK
ncbi:MAG: hypothetical protein NTY68_02235 [Candidatus Micrarchaeota archaeon]|nr:hypothetical protein [Candidatus Micrarchaeota archaeon]